MAWSVQGNLKGPKGDTGATGAKGDKGDAGSGVTIQGSDTWAHIGALGSPAVGDMWILSAADPAAPSPSGGSSGGSAGDGLVWSGSAWTNVGPIRGPQGPQGEQGEQGIQGIQGIQGAKGDTGNTGSDGTAATIAVGTVATGAAGSNAAVTNTGTPTAASFNFTIPRGDKGDTGTAGMNGAKWWNGTGAPGSVAGSSPGDYYLDTTSGDLYVLS